MSMVTNANATHKKVQIIGRIGGTYYSYINEKKRLLCSLKFNHPFASEMIFESTDLENYAQLCSYYEDVNSLFSGDKNRDVVNYLLNKRGLRQEILAVVTDVSEVKRFNIKYEKLEKAFIHLWY